jgi:uncharacterized iron-regulated membrane protein
LKPKEKAMSHTVPSQQPAVALRSNYRHLHALLAIAAAVILGLTVAVVVLATNANHGTLASPTAQSATHANPPAEAGARLDHSGRNVTAADRLANYPDAPAPSESTPQPSVSYYPDAPAPSATTRQQSVGYYLDAPQP